MKGKKPLIILTGPTAVGKTKLSVALAKAVGGEIISADSMQVYRNMDIGSAKITPEEMEGVPHYMIDILDPSENFNVVVFSELCKKYMDRIYKNGHIPILVGGTGFYIQAVLYGIDFTATDENSGYRKKLEKKAETEGPRVLHEQLKKVDPESAAIIHENNVKRVIRALEFYEQTGTPISKHNREEHQKESAYNSCYFVLNDDRRILYEKINRRVDKMFEDGLLEEVRKLKENGCDRSMVSMQGIGYKEVLACLDGEISTEQARERIKLDTRHFAKRQLTWFRREKDVIWIDKKESGYDDTLILNKILSYLKEKSIIG